MRIRFNVNAEPICDPCEQDEFENVARKRQASRKLVALCMKLRCYNEAAQIVSGFADLFGSCSRRIEEVIALAQKEPQRVSFSVDLEPILTEARQEIGYSRRWEREVMETLPDGAAATTMRAAFRQLSAERAKLLRDVMTASDRYLEANAIAWS